MNAPTQTGPNAPVAAQISNMREQFALAMPKGMEATQLVRDAQTCLRQTPQLAECDPATVLGALMTCAQLGLRPGVLGQAYLLPLWNSKNRRREAQLILGYQGLIELVHRSGAVSMIAARVVYSNDEFMLEYGLAEDKLIHRPPLSGPRGEPVAFYAIARMSDGVGYAMTEVMSMADMEKYRDKYAMAKKKDGTVVGPWVTEFVEMAKKTMVRQLSKMLPKSPEVARAITHDGAIRMDTTPAAIDQEPAYVEAEVAPPAVEREPTAEAPAEQAAALDRESLLAALDVAFGEQKITDPAERLDWLGNFVGDQVTSLDDVKDAELDNAIRTLTGN